MCGIAGILHFDTERRIDPSLIKKMTDKIYYRGPDGEGFFVQNNLALGHRRLSIIDLSTGDQPMFSDDNSIVIVFNGEIYNYIELRDELRKFGFEFKTTSDTEVIIKAYEHWGIECQNKFNGMWAFALWDDRKKLLLLSRDRMGEKPLQYSVFDNTIIFGSEIKSIFAYGVPKSNNLELLEIYLALGYVPAPFTFYQGISKLEAGHCLLISGSELKKYKYWDVPDIDEHNMLTNKKEIYEHFENLLKDSVRIRMRSDVPYGAFLSGGLDSSSVVALMSEISSFPVETFTIGFKEKSFDERHLAKLVAEKFKTNHHEHIIEPDTFDESLKKVVCHYDEPFGDSSAIPTGYVSKFAASKVKMVLTGDGGDEVMSGYTTYQGEKFAGQYQKLAGWMRTGIPALTSLVSKPFHGSIRYKLNRVQDVCQSSNLNFIDRYLAKNVWIDESYIKQLTSGLKVHPAKEFLLDFEQRCKYKDPFYKLMYFNQKLSLPDDMLVKVDRMSMAYSLETRTPFLDYRLIEYMAHVHKDIKLHNYERKAILRNSVGQKLPPPLLTAPKRGFSVPLREWFKKDSFNEKLAELDNSMPFLNKGIISEISKINQKGERDFGNFIWMLFIIQKTMENGDY
jgi:asparagine synthase (glutamine-hydrolysing)